MVGDGIAIEPESTVVRAPIKGKIIQIASSHHAIGIESQDGLEVLIHLGINSIELKGKGFEVLIQKGTSINVGDKLLKVNWNKIKTEIPSIITPIVITNKELIKELNLTKKEYIKTGEELFNLNIRN